MSYDIKIKGNLRLAQITGTIVNTIAIIYWQYLNNQKNDYLQLFLP